MSFIIENPTKSVLNSHSECNSFLYTIGMTFGKWLIEKRLDAKLTQVQLAERAGISPNYVSALERDEPNARDGSPRRPRVEKVDRIAKALGVPLSDARLAAGYATTTRKPHNVVEFFEALEAIGIQLEPAAV